MPDKPKIISFDELVRTRPGMFFGDNRITGVINLICGLITDSIYISQNDNMLFTFEILDKGNLSLKINSNLNFTSIIQQFSDEERNTKIYHLRSLQAVSDNFEITTNNNELIINFHLDKAVFIDTAIDYQNLLDEMTMLALLNRGAEILIKDSTKKYLNQNYINFPNGIFYMYNRIKQDALGKPKFEIFYDNEVNGNKYQIVLAYRIDWQPNPLVLSFANDTNTTNGGSLVAGIMDGLILASKKYVTLNELSTHKIKRKKFMNGLIIVCSVRGKNLDFGGSRKESLETKEVRKQSKKIVYKLIYDYLNNSQSQAEELLSRFDTKNFMNKMY